MTPTPAPRNVPRDDVRAQADLAVGAVRIVLGLLAGLLIIAHRPISGSVEVKTLIGHLALITGTVPALNLIARRWHGHRFGRLATQYLDLAACLGLVAITSEPLGDAGWALLVIPLVSAAVRCGPAVSGLSWLAASVGHVLLVEWQLAGTAELSATALRIPGVLLVVTVAVGIVARWMREGWELQHELTCAITERERRLTVVEDCSHAVRGLDRDEAIHLCASQALELGFAAVSVEFDGGRPAFAIGRRALIADREGAPPPPVGQATITHWVEDGAPRVHSTSVLEPYTGTVLTGWSPERIDDRHAQALVALVRQAAIAVETTEHLRVLRHLASRDSLTGVANRRTLDDELARLCARSGRLCVAFVDLDDFKAINDRAGHDAGDTVLKTVAERLVATVGEAGWVARYGGDEFVVVFPGADLATAEGIAQHSLDRCLEPIRAGAAIHVVTASIGLAEACTPVEVQRLLEAADDAAYRAKSHGKSTVVAVSPSRADRVRRKPTKLLRNMPIDRPGMTPSTTVAHHRVP